MKYNILLIGPFPRPIKGVRLANSLIKNQLHRVGINVDFIYTENKKQIESNTSDFDLRKLSFFLTYLKLYKIPFRDIIYITIDQAFFDFLKYLPFLLIARVFKIKTIVYLHGGYLKIEFNKYQEKMKRQYVII